MDHDAIIKAASAYQAAEQDETFAREVAELLARESWEELSDRFYTDLEFGTGGLRGVIAGGFNRMNPFVIARATTGLAQYVVAHGDRRADGSLAAVISHDNRRYSRIFAQSAARVFAAHNITAYLFSNLRPTPELSFAVRQLSASVGVMVTASHNPPEYNGFKVYWSDGAQITSPVDREIIDQVMAVQPEEIHMLPLDEAVAGGSVVYLDATMDDAFVDMVKRQMVQPTLLEERGREVTAVYTPLHGTGAPLIERVLQEMGVTVKTVPEQREPDSEFPTVQFPNPEEASALEMALELGRQEQADIVIGTDPDADRLGIAVPDGRDFTLITGNQLGVLLVDYILGQKHRMGTLPRDPVFATTVVTTGMQRQVAEHYGAQVYETLTGFKHIASIMRRLEEEPGTGTFIMGDEESYGYLIGTEVRDKDAITATVLTIEMALHWRSQGISVLQRLEQLWEQFGYWEEVTISRYFAGQAGKEVMGRVMTELRENRPATFGGYAVGLVTDFLTDQEYLPTSGQSRRGPGLPPSNVLQFSLADGGRVSARPSGTEPKIKFYASCHAPVGSSLAEGQRLVRKQITAIEQEIIAIIDGAV
jgi:phosphoglucomutase